MLDPDPSCFYIQSDDCMNDFSFAAFLSYLIIAILGGAAAAVLAAIVLRQTRRSFWKISFVAAAGAAAVFGYFNIHRSRLVNQIDQNSLVSSPSPKPPSSVSHPDSEAISTPKEARAAKPEGSIEDVFIWTAHGTGWLEARRADI